MTAQIDLVGTEGTACGANFSRRLYLVDADDAPILVASYAALFLTIRKKWAAPDAVDTDDNVVCQVSLGAGLTSEGENVVLVDIDGDLLAVPPRMYVYDVKGVTLLGQKHYPLRGLFEVGPSATRRNS